LGPPSRAEAGSDKINETSAVKRTIFFKRLKPNKDDREQVAGNMLTPEFIILLPRRAYCRLKLTLPHAYKTFVLFFNFQWIISEHRENVTCISFAEEYNGSLQ
jgi:hypothetical protein